ncbi:MAG TPA: winged helix DNA-binding domain-containing protein [Polyangiaceae bacterium]|nr:winged helix DNA-binding domain-containing protein [Polyangiaceae bacterium]
MDQGTLRIARQRLRNQHLVGKPLAGPEDVVRWLGAVQAQEYVPAKWGVAQRTKRCSEAEVEAALNSGTILRTHVLRPTWHFVLPEDIRWLLALSAPRVRAFMAPYDRKVEIDGKLVARSHDVIAATLAGGRHATRKELAAAVAAAGITASGLRLAHLAMHAELSALICSGPRRGKQHTYALLDERVPAIPRAPERDEALGLLALRYFQSHGPAQVQDFAWWAGLTVGDARAGLAAVQERLASETHGGKTFWFSADQPRRVPAGESVCLLPSYDELVVAYKDHAPSFDPRTTAGVDSIVEYLYRHIVVRNGHVIGGWDHAADKGKAGVQLRLFTKLDAAGKQAMRAAIARYERYLGTRVAVALS